MAVHSIPVQRDEESIVHYIGQTPLLRLRRLPGTESISLYAKAEFLNPGGSVKSRTALGMVREAQASGQLHSGATILEATSGNEGIALAMLGAAYGYNVKIVMPANVPRERQLIMEAYGAEVILTPVGETSEETMAKCLAVAEEIAAQPGVFYARQFENPANPDIHARTTGVEIAAQVPGEPAAFVAGVGTGGTLMGVARYLKERWPNVRIVAAEPATSAVLSGRPAGPHGQVGIGVGFIPDIVDTSLIDEVVTVTDEEAFEMTRQLARKEGLLVGVTSGTNVAAAIQVARRFGPDQPVVTLLPDTGERYLSSGLFGKTE